jgi:hypothetical protein
MPVAVRECKKHKKDCLLLVQQVTFLSSNPLPPFSVVLVSRARRPPFFPAPQSRPYLLLTKAPGVPSRLADQYLHSLTVPARMLPPVCMHSFLVPPAK